MKQYLLSLFALLALFTVACTNIDDKDPAPRRTAPAAVFIGGVGYVSANATVAVNQSFKVKYQIAKGSSGLTEWRYSEQKLSGTAPFSNNSTGESRPAGDIQSPETGEYTYSLASTGTLKFKVLGKDLNNLSDSSVIIVSVR